MVAIPSVAFGTMFLVVLLQLAFIRLPRTIRDRKHGDENVILTLEKKQKYHLFLSHVWGTGQDQVAAIKRQLCLLIPGISVFLDVGKNAKKYSLSRLEP